jgi:hypothetical protein
MPPSWSVSHQWGRLSVEFARVLRVCWADITSIHPTQALQDRAPRSKKRVQATGWALELVCTWTDPSGPDAEELRSIAARFAHAGRGEQQQSAEPTTTPWPHGCYSHPHAGPSKAEPNETMAATPAWCSDRPRHWQLSSGLSSPRDDPLATHPRASPCHFCHCGRMNGAVTPQYACMAMWCTHWLLVASPARHLHHWHCCVFAVRAGC